MTTEPISERVRILADRTAVENGLELVHVEFTGAIGNPVIKVFIDKPGGVTHNDCAAVSLQLGDVLDLEDFIHSPYTLEVSSPGLERGLYSLSDFERFTDSLARIKSRVAIAGQRNFRGRILGIEGDEVLFDDVASGKVSIKFDAIVKANLELDVDAEFRKAKERHA